MGRENRGAEGKSRYLVGMIDKTIQGFWHLRRWAAGCGMWLGLSMTVVAQGHWIVETPDLVKTQAMMEAASEEQGRDMAGLVLPASFSFFLSVLFIYTLKFLISMVP